MMVETKYICDLCKASYKEGADRYIFGLSFETYELFSPYFGNMGGHICFNCLRGLEKALKVRNIQKLLGSSEDALDEVLNGNEWRQGVAEVWQTWQNDSDRIAWARGKDYVHLWSHPNETANSLSKLKREIEEYDRLAGAPTREEINRNWFEKVTGKLKEDLQEKAA